MNKKELVDRYKNLPQIGGVFAIKNTILDKWLVDITDDLKAAQNRFDFFGGNVYMRISADFAAQKGEGFVFEVLEELQKSALQTDKEFKDDLILLKSIWMDKLSGQNFY